MTAERIKGFIVATFPAARRRELLVETELLESGILDSLGVLDVVSFLEREFGVLLEDEELIPGNFRSVSTLAAFIETKLASRRQGG